jgi:hypothetical protein
VAFPTVAARNQGAASANVTTTALPLPASIAVNNLLLAWIAIDGTALPTWGAGLAGWNVLFAAADTGTAANVGFFLYKIATGTESGNLGITTASEAWAGHSWRLTGYDPNLPPAFATAGDGATGTTNPNPPALNPADWGTEDTLWLALGAGDGNVAFTAAPASYANSNFQLSTNATTTDRVASGQADRSLNAASDDPGTFTRASEDWLAATVGIRPTPAATVQSILRSGGFYSASGTTPTNAFTQDAGSNRRLMVSVAHETAGVTVSSMTYGGQAMSLVTDGTDTATSTNTARVEWWTLRESQLPANGSQNLVVTLSATAEVYINAMMVAGTDQAVNVRDVVNANTAAATTVTTNVTVGATSDLVVSCCNANNNIAFTNYTVGGIRAMGRGSCGLPTGGAFVMNIANIPITTGSLAVVSTTTSTRQVMSSIVLRAAADHTGNLNLPALGLTGDFTVAGGGSADPPEFVNTVTITNGTNHTVVETNANRLVVVSVCRGAAVGSGSTATYAGGAMSVANNSNPWTQIFYVFNPPVDSNPVVVSGTNITSVTCTIYDNVASFHSSAQGSTLSQSLSPTRRALLAFSMSSGGGGITPLADTTERFDTGGDYYADRIVTAAGTFSVGASTGSDPDSAAAAFLGLADGSGVDIDPGTLTYPGLDLSGSFTVALTVTGSLTLPGLDLSGSETTAVVASGSLTLPSLDLSGSETTAVQASGTLTLPSLDLSGSETTAIVAQGSLALPALQLSGSETTAVVASGSLSLPALQLSGATAGPVEGALALPALTLSGAFTVTVQASGALALPSLDLSGSETTAVAASGALALPALQLTGSEQTAVQASGSLALPSLDLAGSETTQVSASGSLALPALAMAGSFTVGVTVTGAVSFPALQLSGSETTTVAASGSLSLPELELAGEFTVADPNTITGLLALPALQLSGAFTVAVQASGTLALPALGLSGSETTAVAASGALGLPALALSGSETTAVQASGSLALPALQLTGSVAPETANEVSGALALPALTISGSFTVTVAASGALALPALTLNGAVVPGVTLSGSLALPALQLSGSETTLVTVGGNEVSLPPLNQTGSVTVAVSVSGALLLGSLTIDGSAQPIPDAGLPGTGVITTRSASAIVTLSGASAIVTTTLMVSHIVTESGSAKT